MAVMKDRLSRGFQVRSILFLNFFSHKFIFRQLTTTNCQHRNSINLNVVFAIERSMNLELLLKHHAYCNSACVQQTHSIHCSSILQSLFVLFREL